MLEVLNTFFFLYIFEYRDEIRKMKMAFIYDVDRNIRNSRQTKNCFRSLHYMIYLAVSKNVHAKSRNPFTDPNLLHNSSDK